MEIQATIGRTIYSCFVQTVTARRQPSDRKTGGMADISAENDTGKAKVSEAPV